MVKRKQGSHNNNQHKRRRDQDDSDDSNSRQLDPVFGQYRALPISKENLESVTADTVPEDAETYLALVRRQAESGSSVMFVAKEINYDEETGSTIQRKPVIPELSEDQIRLEKHRKDVLDQFQQQRAALPEPGVLDIPEDFVFPENFTEWRAYVMGHEPVMSLISNFDHELTIKLIIYSTRWLNNNIPEQISSWIYALLVRLRDFLESSETATVRELGQRAKKINAKGDDVVSQVTRATNDFIIIIVSRFFGQRDLEL